MNSYLTKRPGGGAKLAFSLAFGLLVGAAWADAWTDSSGNEWTYSGSKVTAVSFETTNLTIPETLGGNTVTSFDASVFAGQALAVRVTIPSSITEIPDNAFLNCENLKAVTIQGEGLKTIGAAAFKGCGNLASFTIPDSVTTLGKGVFSGCSAMESVTLGNGLTTLTGVTYGSHLNGKYNDSTSDTSLSGSYANGLFYNCTSLKTINWGANIKTIGNIAFLNCSALESVTIPDTVTTIGYHAFLGCSRLMTVKIGNSVTVIGQMAFRALPNLTKVTFGNKVHTIHPQAFQDCVNLQNFTLPETIQYLKDRAFAGCNKALTAVTIPTNNDELETELGQGVFSGCTKLATVTFGDTVKTLTGVTYGSHLNGKYNDSTSDTSLSGSYANGLFYNCTSLKTINWGANIKTIGNIAFLNCSALESVTIPDTVTTIGYHAFLGCSNLGNVKIGNGVTTVGRMAFRALPNLTTVTFGTKVSEIQTQAFQDCVNLKNFTLPNTIQYLKHRAFAGCNKALTAVTIPTNKDELETELGQGVFSGCTKLATVTFGDTVKTLTGVTYGSHLNGKYNDSTSNTSLSGSYANGLFYNCTSLKTINWGANIKTIGNIAFLNCSALESVTIPDTVTTIGHHAFLGCSNLVNVKIGNGVTTVGQMAFRALPNLTTVTFGTKVSEIQTQAFQDCVNLKNFTLPNTIQYISYRAFAGCNKALTAVTIPANNEELETELGQGVFSGCTQLATVTFGDTVKTLTGVTYGSHLNGKYNDSTSNTSLSGSYANGLFYNCTSLKTINWGANIKTIGNIAFLKCSALTDVVLPKTITDIGNHAFFGCSSLKTVVVSGDVHSIGRYAFGNCSELLYVNFLGSTITTEPGYMPFKFCNNSFKIFVAYGSTGWKGVAEVSGLPSEGTWCEVPIAYAQYFSIILNKNDGTETTLTQRMIYGAATSLPGAASDLKWAPRRGFKFMGWSESQKSKTVYLNDKATVSKNVAVGATKTLYAIWQLDTANAYAIQYIRNDGSGSVRTIGFIGGVATKLNSVSALGFARRGYDFKGWATSTADAREGKVWKGDMGTVSQPVANGKLLQIYAIWSLKSGYYSIKFNKNDGTGKWRELGYEYGKNTTLPTIANGLGWTRAGYTFAGWATSASSTTAWRTDGGITKTPVAAGKTLNIYAIWKPKSSSSVVVPVAPTTSTVQYSDYDDILTSDISIVGVTSEGGVFELLLANGGSLGYLSIETADGYVARMCEVRESEDGLLLIADDDIVYFVRCDTDGVPVLW